ncbi:MAG: SDR family NAD(P)-dependent oxidoreductase [Chloroflexi bacterium]|nr:SDR family NAD(P)-dependent oxidoreductase [Chloroflexota bacterium]
MLLENQTAIVTGAGRGIGKGIALALARAGASVAVTDINAAGAARTAEDIREAGGCAECFVADVTRSAEVNRLVSEVMAHFGRIDILVNVAGVVNNRPALELPEEEWDQVIAVNLKGVFLMSQRVGLEMAPRGYGRIINISSLSGKVGAPGQAAYCASKHGVLGLNKVLAIDLAPYGITVNAICPGMNATEMAQQVMAQRAAARGQTIEEVERGILSKTPLGRFGRPEDVAEVVLFFAGPGAAYVTGQEIDVDGGRRANLS